MGRTSGRLVLPQCEQHPNHPNHPPPPDKPLRIQVLGLTSILDKLFVDDINVPSQEQPVEAPTDFNTTGLLLAKKVFRALYGGEENPEIPLDFTPRYQYNTFRGKHGECHPWDHTVDGYGITFDHLVDPADDENPETLMLNACDPDDPGAAEYIKLDLGQFHIADRPVVLVVPRCCQFREGSTDRRGINEQVMGTKSSDKGSGPSSA